LFEFIKRKNRVDLWDRNNYLGVVLIKEDCCVLNLNGYGTDGGYKFTNKKEFDSIFKNHVCSKIDFSEEFYDLMNGIFVMNKLCERWINHLHLI